MTDKVLDSLDINVRDKDAVEISQVKDNRRKGLIGIILRDESNLLAYDNVRYKIDLFLKKKVLVYYYKGWKTSGESIGQNQGYWQNERISGGFYSCNKIKIQEKENKGCEDKNDKGKKRIIENV